MPEGQPCLRGINSLGLGLGDMPLSLACQNVLLCDQKMMVQRRPPACIPGGQELGDIFAMAQSLIRSWSQTQHHTHIRRRCCVSIVSLVIMHN
jgi:hypothetical protein